GACAHVITSTTECPLLAHSRHRLLHCACPLPGVKRTCRFALHMSAYDPKRTSVRPETAPSRAQAQIATITCLSLGGDDEATPIHTFHRWRGSGVSIRFTCAASSNARDRISRYEIAYCRRAVHCSISPRSQRSRLY